MRQKKLWHGVLTQPKLINQTRDPGQEINWVQ
jgi:hypothetical protein